MYGALWRILPGNRFVKTVEMLVLALAVVAVLFLWVFPAIAPLMPYNEVTIEGGTPTAPVGTSTSG